MTTPLDSLLTTYDLTPPLTPFPMPGGLNNSSMGIHTGAGDFVLKTLTVHKDRAMLRYEHALLAWLATQPLSFQVPTPMPTRRGDTLVTTPTGYELLVPYVAGQRPHYTEAAQMEAMGAALAELHSVLAHYPLHPRPGMGTFGILEQTHTQLADPYHLTPSALGLAETPDYMALFAWWRNELEQLRRFIDGPFTQLPRQVIHCDYSPSNTVYNHGRITAILDFEFAGPDVRAMDLASGLVFTLRLWENAYPLQSAAAFCRGYGAVQRLTTAEIEALPWLIRLGYATSTIWWFGRGLADGQGHYPFDKLHDMQQMVDWLHHHEQELLATTWTYLH